MRFLRKHKSKIVILSVFALLASLVAPVSGMGLGREEIRINVPSRTLRLYMGGVLIREYPVGVGNSRQFWTPPGSYRVATKILHPIWEDPFRPLGDNTISAGSHNPLGERWIGFHSDSSGDYGIHGTNDPSSVGKFISHGCVRMYNRDVAELFEMVSRGTPVRVTYDRYRLTIGRGHVYLEVYPDPYDLRELRVGEIVADIRRLAPMARQDRDLIARAIREVDQGSIYEVAAFYGG
jgi:hypothetical protein